MRLTDVVQPRSLTRRFFERVVHDETGCWLWIGKTLSNGYGTISAGVAHQHLLAHRVSYMVFYGEVDDTKLVLHTCDVRRCINPEHLYQGTQQQNMRDMVDRGRHGGGAQRGSANPDAKLTEAQVVAIRARYVRRAMSAPRLAKEYGVCTSTIHNILHRRTWTHI